MLPLIFAAAAAARIVYKLATTEKAAPTPSYAAAEKIVALVGAASSGKSSTGNALLGRSEFQVGPEHGTTMIPKEVSYANGYRIRDVPGLLDGPLSSHSSIESLKSVQIVVYVCKGQLFRQEVEFLRELHTSQSRWNLYSSGAKRHLVVFCNKRDVVAATMTKAELLTQDEALIAQIAGFVPRHLVFYGASRPKPPQSPNVGGLEQFIRTVIS